jgi:tetratricopeptide (TPR) repeat protein
VRTTWSLAVAELGQEEPVAVDLLNLGAFLAPEAIPHRLLAEHRDALPSPLAEAVADGLRWGDLVEALRAYSLVGVADGSLIFHRLVQASTRDGLPSDERRHWAEAAVQLVNAALPRPPWEHTNWPAIGALLPHALAAAEAAERLEVGLEVAATVLNEIAVYHRARAAWAEAEPLFERALAIGEKTLGPEHPDAAIRLNNLAELYRATGRYAQAEPLYRRTIAILEKNLPPDHPYLVMALKNYAGLLDTLGRSEEAAELWARAEAIRQRREQPPSPPSP